MASFASPFSDRTRDTRRRLECCWELDISWDKYPEIIKKGCSQVAKSMSVPPATILGGLLILTSFMISPASVTVPGTDWSEPTLVWLIINMPTGSRKTTVYQFMRNLLQDIRKESGCTGASPSWMLQDATFEKMGVMMHDNNGRLLGLFDELSAFLTKIRLYNTRGITDSHELAMFLELYNANPWTRITVTGEANFSMESTSLTVGGFNQPSMARSLMELPGNAEKGLSQRFLWLCPKPIYNEFTTLGKIDKSFNDKIVKALAAQWRNVKAQTGINKQEFSLPAQDKEDSAFRLKYDEIQKQLQSIAGMDDLISGTLSKSMGQILRISAAMHVLFHMESEEELPSVITEQAISAAIDFVEVCCQHTAYLTGRGIIAEELKLLESGSTIPTQKSREAYVLTLPGKCLDVSNLVNIKKKFRNKGGREGALHAMRQLVEDGMGELKEKKNKGSVKTWEFHKRTIPEELEEKGDLAEKLAKYNISLLEYSRNMEATMEKTPKKEKEGSHSPKRSKDGATPSKRLKF